MDIPFDYHDDMAEGQLIVLYRIVPDYMCANTDMNDTRHNSAFMICEGIIDKLIISMRPLGLLD